MRAERVLVVDDEPDLGAVITYQLAKAGFRVSTASGVSDAVCEVEEVQPGLVIVSATLGGVPARDVVTLLQAGGRHKLLALVLGAGDAAAGAPATARSTGASGYLVMPFTPTDLLTHVRAVFKDAETGGALKTDTLSVGPIWMDRAARRVRVGGTSVELTPTEYTLLLTLAERRGRPQSRAHLLALVAAAGRPTTRTIATHMYRLRGKLGPAAGLLETVRGVGYRLRDPAVLAESTSNRWGRTTTRSRASRSTTRTRRRGCSSSRAWPISRRGGPSATRARCPSTRPQ
jgi:two-component system phosphate regulon response regulator PhoB